MRIPLFPDKNKRVFYLCSNDDSAPFGGIKKVYQHVDMLNAMGQTAYVVHSKMGLRMGWFENSTPIVYMTAVQAPLVSIDTKGHERLLPPFSEHDILVVSEQNAYKIVEHSVQLHLYTVIFNQNAYLSFRPFSLPSVPFYADHTVIQEFPYKNENVLGTIIISEQNGEYLKFAYPDIKYTRIHIGVEESIFCYEKNKQKQIAFMPRKCKTDALQIVCLLEERGKLKDWIFYPIDNMPETEVAKVLKESAIFMSFSYQEGFGLAALEAMICGCIVVGYHGYGGTEFVREPYAYPIEQEDILGYAKKVEEIAQQYESHPEKFVNMALHTSKYMKLEYSQDREKDELKQIWTEFFLKHDKILSTSSLAT